MHDVCVCVKLGLSLSTFLGPNKFDFTVDFEDNSLWVGDRMPWKAGNKPYHCDNNRMREKPGEIAAKANPAGCLSHGSQRKHFLPVSDKGTYCSGGHYDTFSLFLDLATNF